MIGIALTRRAWLRHWLAACGLAPLLQPDADLPGRRAITLTARKFTFDPDVIDVRHNDLVRLTITSADIAHSFTVDAYRIQKRIPPAGTVTFEFRADEVGRFPFYCSMRADPGCAEMRGELIVR
jgi:heme/copper-type cytochrome/quinol oxidase subunit 2